MKKYDDIDDDDEFHDADGSEKNAFTRSFRFLK